MAKKTVGRINMYLNITSMLDVVMNLLTFFILINNFAALELPMMEAPVPDDSQAQEVTDQNKVVVNVISVKDADNKSLGQPLEIRVGQTKLPPDAYGDLSAMLIQEKARSPELVISLRADKTLPYETVAPVLQAISSAQIKKVNLAATIKDKKTE